MWRSPWRRRQRESLAQENTAPWGLSPAVDLDRDVVPLNDGDDPTSLLFAASMERGAVMLAMDDETGEWVVTAEGGLEWRGRTQTQALRLCLEDTP